MIIVLSVIAFLLLLPYIYVDITVQADGLIRPVHEKTEIKPITSGIVTEIFIKESQAITKGDTLLVFNKDNIESKIDQTKYQFSQNKDFIHDLTQLANRHMQTLVLQANKPLFFTNGELLLVLTNINILIYSPLTK